MSEQPLIFTYCNYQGEVSVRRVVPERIEFTSTKWHPEAQWILHAFDFDKNAVRGFAMGDMIGEGAATRLAADTEARLNALTDRVMKLTRVLIEAAIPLTAIRMAGTDTYHSPTVQAQIANAVRLIEAEILPEEERTVKET
jgi:hypothetical protein